MRGGHRLGHRRTPSPEPQTPCSRGHRLRPSPTPRPALSPLQNEGRWTGGVPVTRERPRGLGPLSGARAQLQALELQVLQGPEGPGAPLQAPGQRPATEALPSVSPAALLGGQRLGEMLLTAADGPTRDVQLEACGAGCVGCATGEALPRPPVRRAGAGPRGCSGPSLPCPEPQPLVAAS